jgi:hypothetical protein
LIQSAEVGTAPWLNAFVRNTNFAGSTNGLWFQILMTDEVIMRTIVDLPDDQVTALD